MQLADEAWMLALRAHRDSNDPATLPNRLAVTAAAARNLAAALQHAIDLGHGWQPYPGSADHDSPPGELYPDNAQADHRWQNLYDASHRLARAVRGDDAHQIIAAYKAFATAWSRWPSSRSVT